MVGRRQLEQRMTVLSTQLNRVRSLIEGVDDPTPEQRVKAKLMSEWASVQGAISCDGAAVATADGRTAPDEIEIDGWNRCADAASALRRLAQLTLELRSGLEARRAGVDDGLCALADSIARAVSALDGPPWMLATVPAEAELFSERDLLIRLRWPGDGIWTLPLILHELGHFVGRRLERSHDLDGERWALLRPLEDRLIATGEEIPADWHHLHELFADSYATYVGGPAYLACCVGSAMQPGCDQRDTRTHPAPTRRVAIMLEILRRMDDMPDNTSTMAFEIEAWRDSWARAVTGSGGRVPDTLTDADQELVDFLWALLYQRLPSARYRTLATAKELAMHMRQPDDVPRVAVDATGIDVLNAAWFARRQLGPDEEDGDLAKSARSLLEIAA